MRRSSKIFLLQVLSAMDAPCEPQLAASIADPRSLKLRLTRRCPSACRRCLTHATCTGAMGSKSQFEIAIIKLELIRAGVHWAAAGSRAAGLDAAQWMIDSKR
jgi:hypothetical protein